MRITAKQFRPAEDDLREALKHGKTPLRLFHYALAQQGQRDGGGGVLGAHRWQVVQLVRVWTWYSSASFFP